MDDVPWWWPAGGWGVRLTDWTLAKLTGRRRGQAEGHADPARMLARLPVAVVPLGPMLSLAGFWPRHRYALRAEREPRLHMVAVATLPAGSQVREQRGDGSQLVRTVGAGKTGAGGE